VASAGTTPIEPVIVSIGVPFLPVVAVGACAGVLAIDRHAFVSFQILELPM
jgi:hypothetical protein